MPSTQGLMTTLRLPVDLHLLSVLANSTRIDVLASLASGEKCVSDIAIDLSVEESVVSHALRKLLDKQLVEKTIVQNRHFYKLSQAVRAHLDGADIRLEITSGTIKVVFTIP